MSQSCWKARSWSLVVWLQHQGERGRGWPREEGWSSNHPLLIFNNNLLKLTRMTEKSCQSLSLFRNPLRTPMRCLPQLEGCCLPVTVTPTHLAPVRTSLDDWAAVVANNSTNCKIQNYTCFSIQFDLQYLWGALHQNTTLCILCAFYSLFTHRLCTVCTFCWRYSCAWKSQWWLINDILFLQPH